MPNDNIMGISTRACINGFTKEDTERLKNALVKQILNDETVVNVTEDGKIIVANDDGLFLSFDDSVIGLTKDDDDNVIPVADPYIPMDENDNLLAPDNNVIMTSGNIAVDPRIVHTTGNESISGIKTYAKPPVLAYHEAGSNNLMGWRKLLISPNFSNSNESNICIFELTDNNGHHVRLQLNGRNGSLTGISIVYGNIPYSDLKISRSSNGEIIIWGKNFRTVASLIYEVHVGANYVSFVDSGTTTIFDEPTTDTYAQILTLS